MGNSVFDNPNNLEGIVGFAFDWSSEDFNVFQRTNDKVNILNEIFSPFFIANHEIEKFLDPSKHLIREIRHIDGNDFFDTLVFFNSPKFMSNVYNRLDEKAKSFLDRKYDVVTQYQLLTGRTMYHGMGYEDVRRMQVDVVKDDKEIEINVRTNAGNIHSIRKKNLEESLEEFTDLVKADDPDIIEVYELERTLGFLLNEAKTQNIQLNLGRVRKAQEPYYKPRTTAVDRFHPRRHLPRINIAGRQAIDLYLALYTFNKDMGVFRSLQLPSVLSYFEINDKIHKLEQLDLISQYTMPTHFHLAQICPLQLQSIYRIGTANIIDHLLIGAYLREGQPLPQPILFGGYEGGRTELFKKRLSKNVWKVDIRSMYPSIMLVFNLAPSKDSLGKFLPNLWGIYELRQIRKKERNSYPQGSLEYKILDFEQTHLKRLDATHFGYMGSPLYHFNDGEHATQVTAEGRTIITIINDYLKEREEKGLLERLELDTDGIYFSSDLTKQQIEAIVFDGQKGVDAYTEEYIKSHNIKQTDSKIQIELEGPWKAALFEAIKNYFLLGDDIVVKGSGLRGKNYPLFLLEFMRGGAKLYMEGNLDGVKELYMEYEEKITKKKLKFEDVVVESICRFSPEVYNKRVNLKGKGRLNRQAHMELMLKSNGLYGVGDILPYFVAENEQQAQMELPLNVEIVGGDNLPLYNKVDFASNFSPDRINESYYLRLLRNKAQKLFGIDF